MENNQKEFVDIVKKQASKLPTGVLIGVAVGGLVVLSRLKSPIAKTVIRTAVPVIALEVLNKIFNKDASVTEKVIEKVEAISL